MKKLFYLSAIFVLSVSLLNATNTEELINDNKDIKIEAKEKLKEGKTLLESSVAKKYKGICRDGSTVIFSAKNRDEAQGYINGYCAGLRESRESTEVN